MTPELVIITVLAPFAIFGIALILRLAADALPETAASANYRRVLLICSYASIGVGFMALFVGMFITQIVGVIQLLLFVLGGAQLLDVEALVYGQRRRAQQAELLWMLASTARNQGNLADELDLYASGTWGARHRQLVDLARRLREGVPLIEIAVPQGLLPQGATLEIQAGLQAGRLHESLQAAAARHTKEVLESSENARFQLTLMHPTVVLTAVVSIVGFLMYWIVPKFKKIFDDFGTDLPDSTKFLISTSDSFFNIALIIQPLLYIPLIIIVIMGFAEIHGWRAVTRRILGWLSVRPYTAELLRALAQSVSGQVPLPVALEKLNLASGSVLLHKRLTAVRVGIESGASCWNELSRQGFLTTREAVLLECAEAVGNLPWTLNAIADNLERRWTFRMYAVLEMFGPIVVLVLGFVVGLVAIAFFMPLVKLLNDLS